MDFNEVVNTIKTDTEQKIFGTLYEDVFKGPSKKALKDRGYTGLKYALWVGNYFDGYVNDKEYALKWAKRQFAKNGNTEGVIKVFEIPVNHPAALQFFPSDSTGKQIFPPIQEDVFKGPDPEEVAQRKNKARMEWEKNIWKVAEAKGITIRYLVPPISDSHLSSFWYGEDVAVLENPTKGRSLTLTAQGDIRVQFRLCDPNGNDDGLSCSYRGWAAREEAERRGYTDADINDEDKVIFDNNNWFEFWYGSTEWEGEKDLSVAEGVDIMGDYQEGIEWAVDLLSNDSEWEETTGQLHESINEDVFKGPSQEDLESRPGYLRHKAEQEEAERRREIQTQRRLARMRTHPDQANLAKQWVEGSRNKGSASNLRVEGNVMVSYYTPIAIRQDGFIYMVDKKFSVSTSRQQSYIRRAVPEDSLVLLSVSDFKDKLSEVGGYYPHAWLGEAQGDPFKGPSQEDLEKRGALKYLPRQGNFPYKFMKHIADPDPEASNWDIVGVGRLVNYENSDIYFGADEDPQFVIMFDTEAMLEENLDPSPELTEEFKEFDGPVDEWLRFKGWKIEYSGHTANEDNAYYWGDEVYGYTSFSAEKDDKILGGVVIEFRGKDVVYLGDYMDAEMGLLVQDPEQQIADFFGYHNYKNLVYEIKKYRETLTPEEEEAPRDEEPSPGQHYWNFGNEGEDGQPRIYMESKINEDVFKSADPKEIKKRVDRAKEIRAELARRKYDFPFTYEDITQLPIYKRIVRLPNVKDVTKPQRKKNRALHFQYKKDHVIKDWDISANGRIGSNSGDNYRGNNYRIKQFPRAATIDEFVSILEEGYKIIARFVKKMKNRKVQEDIFKGVNPDEGKWEKYEIRIPTTI